MKTTALHLAILATFVCGFLLHMPWAYNLYLFAQLLSVVLGIFGVCVVSLLPEKSWLEVDKKLKSTAFRRAVDIVRRGEHYAAIALLAAWGEYFWGVVVIISFTLAWLCRTIARDQLKKAKANAEKHTDVPGPIP